MRLAGLFVLALVLVLASADDAGLMVRPVDRPAFARGPVEVNAAASGGRLELDGQAVTAETPFPNVLHAKLQPSPGRHKLALVWASKEQLVSHAE